METIKSVLEMDKWNNPKYQSLLSPSIWLHNLEKITTILKMPEWDTPEYQGLLTPCVWKSSVPVIKKILTNDLLHSEKYKHLLVPSIFNVSFSNISKMIELFKEYGIDEYITNRCLRQNVKLEKILLDHLIENNIDLVIDCDSGKKLNPILNASNAVLKSKYGIDLKRMKLEDTIGYGK